MVEATLHQPWKYEQEFVLKISQVINMIFGGPTTAGTSRLSRKDYAREVMYIEEDAPKWAIVEGVTAFDGFDLEGLKFSYDDPLVVTPMIENLKLKES